MDIDKGANNLAAAIRSICIKYTYIDSIYAMDTWIRCSNIGHAYTRDICIKDTSIRDAEPRVLVRSEII